MKPLQVVSLIVAVYLLSWWLLNVAADQGVELPGKTAVNNFNNRIPLRAPAGLAGFLLLACAFQKG